MSYITPQFERPLFGDQSRRVALGLSVDELARRAGITTEELVEYEVTPFYRDYDPEVAARVGETLHSLETKRPLIQ